MLRDYLFRVLLLLLLCLFVCLPVLNKKATTKADFFLFYFLKLSLFALAMFLLPGSPAWARLHKEDGYKNDSKGGSIL